MILIEKGIRYNYFIYSNGIIYRGCKSKITPIEKRLGTRGYCEFKMNGKTVVYHQIVAKFLIPNPKKSNKVFFNSEDRFDMRPENLRWVWTRENRTLTEDEAIEIATDNKIIECYKTGDKKRLKILINNYFNKHKFPNDFLGELYIIINNYADRNLIFDLDKDIPGTFLGLIKQQYRKKIKILDLKQQL